MRAPARRGARRRQRAGHSAGGPRAHLRAVLHHQAGRQGHRPRPRHRPAAASATTTPRSRSNRARAARSSAVSLPLADADGAAGARVNKPVMLVVDDDPQVLAAVRRDLRVAVPRALHGHQRDVGRGGARHHSRAEGRGDALAIVISDQRMPGMQGTELLARSREIYPLARRVLLTAYSDIDAAIKAINDAHLDHYLSKPWDPPEEMPVPGHRRPARRLAGGVPARRPRACGSSGTVVAALARDQGLPRRQPDPVSLAGRGARSGHAQPAGRRGRGRERAAGAVLRGWDRAAQSRAARRSPSVSADRCRRPSSCTTW